jgi:hypothetical protein
MHVRAHTPEGKNVKIALTPEAENPPVYVSGISNIWIYLKIQVISTLTHDTKNPVHTFSPKFYILYLYFILLFFILTKFKIQLFCTVPLI